MNNPNRSRRCNEKLMHAITKAMSVAVLVALGLTLTAWTAEPPKADDTQSGALPFTVKVTKEELEVSPPYMGAKGQDFPFNAVKIEGEYWAFLGGKYRWMGTNFLNTVKQPDSRGGRIPVKGAIYFLGGMWYDAAEKTLYAPLHCAMGNNEPNPQAIRRVARMAAEPVMGLRPLTWCHGLASGSRLQSGR